jgi:hypothetical protein
MAASVKRWTRAGLIEVLAKELVRREPDMASHMDDARYRVSHTSPGQADTLSELALSARIRDLISEDEYKRAAPDPSYGGAEWAKRERRRERSRHEAASKKPRAGEDAFSYHARRIAEADARMPSAIRNVLYADTSRPSLPPGTKRG